MRRSLTSIAALLVTGGIVAGTMLHRVSLPNQTDSDGRTLLPNGWALTPAGRPIKLPGDMPLKMAVSPDGKQLLVVTGGWHNEGVSAIDVASEALTQTVDLGNAWAGLAITGSEAWVAGSAKGVHRVTMTAEGLEKGDDVEGTAGGWISGIASHGNATYVIDVNRGSLSKFVDGKLSKTVSDPSARPYGIAVSHDGSEIAVSLWGRNQLYLLDSDALKIKATVNVGSHPNDLAYSADGRLFVACAGSNEVDVVQSSKVRERIKTSVDRRDPVGSTPDSVALAPDGKTLYVANADNNDVAVVDISRPASHVKGLIPTGWYPSALAVSPDGKKLFVGTGKGLKFGPNGSVSASGRPQNRYINSLLAGTVNVVDVPGDEGLAKYTAQTIQNMPMLAEKRSTLTPGLVAGAFKKIKHVVYIIRENRTYDQVFGDLPKANGDPSLVMFGREVTPNAHRLAETFVTLDNLYCNGEVSQDGHQWCNAAYATDFTERAYVGSYSGRGEPKDDEGLANSPGGYLWDACRKAHRSYLSYGEFADFKSDPTHAPVFDGISGLEGHASLKWAQFDQRPVATRDFDKVDIFIDDLHQAEKSGKWNDYMVMSLGEDHTSGLRPGAFTPRASVASNDVALGKIVDAISHSPFWKDTAIFVIEDDAQDGPDHVDAHRTAGLVISPYVRRGVVDSTQYATTSMVRTMELILGLKPMSQYDQRATIIANSFTAKPDFTPYQLIPAEIDLFAKNPARGELEEKSAKLDWSHYDAADPGALNEILWRALRPGQRMPAPVRGTLIRR